MFVSLTALASTLCTSLVVHAPSPEREDVSPSVVLTSSGLVVAWVARTPTRAEVVFARAADLETFGPLESVSGTLDGDAVVRPHAAARGDRVVITWADASSGDLDVRAVISVDGGRTFSAPVLVAGGPGSQSDPRALVLADGGVAITFQDNFGATASGGGLLGRVRIARAGRDEAFGAARAVGDVDPREAIDLVPALAGAGTSTQPLALVHVRARHAGGRAAQLLREGAAGFGAPVELGAPFDRPRAPRAARSSLGVVVVFDGLLPAAEQRIPGLAVPDAALLDVGLALVPDASSSAQATLLNTTRALSQSSPDVAAEAEDVVVAWIDHAEPGRRRIVGRRSQDGGRTFSEEVALSDGAHEVRAPAVAVRSGAAFVAFEEESGGSFDVHIARWP